MRALSFDKLRMRANEGSVEILMLSLSRPVLSDAAGGVEGHKDFGPPAEYVEHPYRPTHPASPSSLTVPIAPSIRRLRLAT